MIEFDVVEGGKIKGLYIIKIYAGYLHCVKKKKKYVENLQEAISSS